MKTKLTKPELVSLLPQIKRVLDTGKPWEDEHLHHPVEAIVNAILSIPGIEEKEDGFETNGWQWDWWHRFKYKGKEYTLSGSGYYGGHAFHETDIP